MAVRASAHSRHIYIYCQWGFPGEGLQNGPPALRWSLKVLLCDGTRRQLCWGQGPRLTRGFWPVLLLWECPWLSRGQSALPSSGLDPRQQQALVELKVEEQKARLARFWLPVSGLEALLSATASTGAAAEEGLVVCAGVAGLCAAAVWTGVLAGVPASAGAYVDKMSCQSAWWIASAWCITSDC
ncbi:MAG: hypothetical protein FRX49_09712 [Trebouxia sp. A1-2]|nr:MAG: hypothetical protein FRX49_09712 [Trebouxia sp. A1-2]